VIGWIAEYAASRGLKYEPEADERWLRAWEPYVTLKTPVRYAHALLSTGSAGSLSIARFSVPTEVAAPGGGATTVEASAWIVIAQDMRMQGRAAMTSDPSRIFSENPELISVTRRATGDAAFDHAFFSFAPSDADLQTAVTPSLRKLLLGWRIPVHVEVRPGGFIVAPVALGADPTSLSWLVSAVHVFGDKAAKRI
jgi:hypothetical protein